MEMGRFWDERARDDALFYVDDRGLRGDAFWAGGEEVVEVFATRLGWTVGPRDTVVEIGCGVGRITRALAAHCHEVLAVDVSAEMLTRARELEIVNVRWLLGDGRTLPVPDASADGVFSHVVFQHVPDPAITLGYVGEMGRVLRPGGWAVFQVSDDARVHRRRLLARGPARHPAWRGSAVDLTALRQAAEDASLDVERVEGAGTQFCLIRLRRR
jgi:SAM-dependent methyltransferase